MIYLLAVTFILPALYIVLSFLFSLFFDKRLPKFTPRSIVSMGLIFLSSALSHKLAIAIADPELDNRVLHALGGGLVPFLVCFLVVRDNKISVDKFRFLVFSSLIVTSMGVGNEILEFALQSHSTLVFAPTINDTWLDLVSNTVGAIFGAILFTPFVSGKKEK